METKFISSKLSFVVLLLCLTCVFSVKIWHGKIYDEKNRQLYLHGVNVAVKIAPYIPKTDAYDPKMSFTKEDIENLTMNGFNAIRLGIMWPGV
jgi:endoglycosylceramidase